MPAAFQVEIALHRLAPAPAAFPLILLSGSGARNPNKNREKSAARCHQHHRQFVLLNRARHAREGGRSTSSGAPGYGWHATRAVRVAAAVQQKPPRSTCDDEKEKTPSHNLQR
jgi:hypothetical protein